MKLHCYATETNGTTTTVCGNKGENVDSTVIVNFERYMNGPFDQSDLCKKCASIIQKGKIKQ